MPHRIVGSLAVLLAGAITASGCVTTSAVSPAGVAALAGLPEDKESSLQTADGPDTVSGSTEVTLRWSMAGGAQATHEAPLSSLRNADGSLVLSDSGQTLALNDIWSAEITKPDPGRTAGLVVGVVVGTAVLSVALYFIVGAIALNNALSRL